MWNFIRSLFRRRVKSSPVYDQWEMIPFSFQVDWFVDEKSGLVESQWSKYPRVPDHGQRELEF